jgi:hypothetical protein
MEVNMHPKVIVIDGITYRGVHEMPPDIRQKYEQAMRSLGDANNNSIPDAFESLNILADQDRNGAPDVLENILAGHAAVNRMKFIVDGEEFTGLQDLPPEVRARYEEAMRGLDANGNGMPDFVEGMLDTSGQTVNVSGGSAAPTPRRVTFPTSNPAITPDTSNGWMLLLGGLFIFALCVAGAAGVWYVFLR